MEQYIGKEKKREEVKHTSIKILLESSATRIVFSRGKVAFCRAGNIKGVLVFVVGRHCCFGKILGGREVSVPRVGYVFFQLGT